MKNFRHENEICFYLVNNYVNLESKINLLKLFGRFTTPSFKCSDNKIYINIIYKILIF